MSNIDITDHEFEQFQRFIYDAAGISLSPVKKALVGGRLSKRLRQCGVATYGEYFKLLSSGQAPEEVQRVDVEGCVLVTDSTPSGQEARQG